MNYDFFIWHADGLSVHFDYDGCFQIHNDNDRVHYKDLERAIRGFVAFKKIMDSTN